MGFKQLGQAVRLHIQPGSTTIVITTDQQTADNNRQAASGDAMTTVTEQTRVSIAGTSSSLQWNSGDYVCLTSGLTACGASMNNNMSML